MSARASWKPGRAKVFADESSRKWATTSMPRWWLKERLERARLRERAVREAKGSYAGLAPWDAVALEARRAWGDVPEPPGGAPTEMLKGAEVVALFEARFGVSRATYYSQYRPLLRSYHVTPLSVSFLAGDGIAVHREATKRFRRDEVEALFEFLVADAV